MSRSAPAGMSGQDIDQMILRELGRIIRTAALSPGDAQADIAIAQIKAFIADHLESDLRCGTLAANFDLSERTLARWFHDRAGESVGRYVLHARIAEALRLLRASTLPLADSPRQEASRVRRECVQTCSTR